MRKVYLAADVGAGSGRVLAGIYENGKISLDEVARFDNQPVEQDGSLRWDIQHIFSQIKAGIRNGIEKYGDDVKSIGVDTWGVDYGLLDSKGELLETPFCYRDARTDGMLEKANEVIEQPARYAIAGLQTLHFNTLYQLLAHAHAEGDILEQAESLLFVPDLLNFWLSGEKANETTIASTSELMEAKSGKWSKALLEKFDLPQGIFQDLKEPGFVLGTLRDSIAEEVGSSINVVVVPSHDTAAAVAACPLVSPESVYISSGTWSLMGMETDQPYTDAIANAMALTNERGVEGTTRLLKNISGFWIFQQCKRDWDERGLGLGYDELRELAIKAEPFQAYLDPNDSCFEQPGNMLNRIGDYFERTGQVAQNDPGIICRTIFEGLALSYRKVLKGLENVTGKTLTTINIIGGGSRNVFLNQLTANATGCEVIAGPTEGSGLGNILAQLAADGEIVDIRSGREIIRNSFELNHFTSENDLDWVAANEAFKKTCG